MTVPTVEEVQKEFAAAMEALEDAEANLSEKRLKTAVSRAYYAAFHAARAVLWSKALAPKTHKGVQILFELHVVKENLASKTDRQYLKQLYDERELADYHALAGAFYESDVEKLVSRAKKFVAKMEEILGNTRAR